MDVWLIIHWLQIRFIADNDPLYEGGPVLASQGTLSYCTCFHCILIPASYILTLVNNEYNLQTELPTFSNAVDHWLLVQILSVIGFHTTFCHFYLDMFTE